MKTLLDAARADKLSAPCQNLLRFARAETPVHALIYPSPRGEPAAAGVHPEPVDDAIRTAGRSLGAGLQLVGDLKERLKRRTGSLRLQLPGAVSLWLADALAVEVPAVELARLSLSPDVRRIDLQPRISPARRARICAEPAAETSRLGLHLGFDTSATPTLGVIDTLPADRDAVAVDACFDAHGRPGPVPEKDDELGSAWDLTLRGLVPACSRLRAGVFDDGSATFAQVVAGLQWTLERGADVVVVDLGEAALDPIWHRPFLNCTLYGTSVVVAGAPRAHKDRDLWPIHVPLAGCYDRGPLRSDLLVSGASVGAVEGSLAAAARTVAAIVLLQTVAPRLRHDPAALVGPLFAGPERGVAPRGEVELDPESMLRAICSAA